MSEAAIDFQPASAPAQPAEGAIDFQPAAQPAEPAAQGLPARLEPWRTHIENAAIPTVPSGVPLPVWKSYIAAVVDRESNGRNVETGADGHGHGLMQIDDRFHDFAKTPDVADPQKNINYGAGYLHDLFNKTPVEMPLGERLQRTADAYNAGPPALANENPDQLSTGGNYGSDVIRRVNQLRGEPWEPPPAKPTLPGGTPPALLALIAEHSGVQGPEAAQAADLAQRSGLGQQFVSDNFSMVRDLMEKKDFADFLRSAPPVMDWAAQSSANAAAVKADQDSLAAMHFWFGRSATHIAPEESRRLAKDPSFAGIDYPITTSETVQQAGPTQAYAQAVLAQQANLLEIKRATAGLTPDETQRLQDLNDLTSAPIPGNEGFVRKIATTLAGAAPFLAGLAATGSAKAAQAYYFTQQSFGPMFAKLADARDENGKLRFTKAEARIGAGVAAAASGIAMAYTAGAFVRVLPGATEGLNGALDGAVFRWFLENPSTWKVFAGRAVQAGNHILSGIAMMMGQGSGNGAIEALARGHKFGLPSVSMGIIYSRPGGEAWRDVAEGAYEGAKTGAAFFPLALYHGAVEFHRDLGRLSAAAERGTGARVEYVPPDFVPALPEPASGQTVDVGEPPPPAAPAAPPMSAGTRDRVVRDLTLAHDEAVARGGDVDAWRKAIVRFGAEPPPEARPPLAGLINDLGRMHDAEQEQVRLDELVKASRFSKLLKAAPDQAQQLFEAMAPLDETARISVEALEQNPEAAAAVEKALGEDGPRALSEASETRGDVPVPIATYLAKVAPEHHDALREDVKLSDTGMTPAEAKVFRDFMARVQGEPTPGVEEAGKEFAKGIVAAAKRFGLPPEKVAADFPFSTQILRAKAREAARTQAITTAPTPAVPDEALPAYLEAEKARLKTREAAPSDAEISAAVERALGRPLSPLDDIGGAAVQDEDLDRFLAAEKERLKARPPNPTVREIEETIRRAVGNPEPPAATPTTPPAAEGPSPVRIRGRKALVFTPQHPKGEWVQYGVIDIHDLIPSHSFRDFGPEPEFPPGVQERNYLGLIEEQMKVETGSINLNNDLLLTDTPSPLDGPPTVTEGKKALVAGGTGRSLMAKRAFDADPAKAASYKAELLRRADMFGLDKAAIENEPTPFLVRVVLGLHDTPDHKDLIAAVRRFNEGMTQKLSERGRAIAEARTMTQGTVEDIGNLLTANGESTLREVMRDKPLAMVALLRRGGVITPQNQMEWLTNGMLSDSAKDRIEAMFVGRVMDSEERMNRTRPLLLAKVERIATSLMRVAGQAPKYDETATVRRAVDFINEAEARGVSTDDMLMQEQMFATAPPPAPDVIAMADLLKGTGQKSLQARFRQWDDLLTGAPLFQKTPPTIEDARKVLFAPKGAIPKTLFQRGVIPPEFTPEEAEHESKREPFLRFVRGGEGDSPADLFDRIAAGAVKPESLSREQLLSIAEWNDPNGTWSDERDIKQLESEQKALEGEAAKLSEGHLTPSKLFDLGNEIYEPDRPYSPSNENDVRDMLSGVDFQAPLPAEPLAKIAVKYIRAQMALERLRDEYGEGPTKEDLVATINEWIEDSRPTPPDEPSNVRTLLKQPAYHGSPHRFEKFSMQHVGTGQGAQSYGHGIYFAENPEVAKHYRESLSRGAVATVVENGRTLTTPEMLARYFAPGNIVPGYGTMDKVLSFHPGNEGQGGYGWSVDVIAVKRDGEPKPGERARTHYTFPTNAEIKSVLAPKGLNVSEGTTYKVDVPESDRLLDYDRPLGAQSQQVKDALRTAGIDANDRMTASETGQALYRQIGGVLLNIGKQIEAGAERSLILRRSFDPTAVDFMRGKTSFAEPTRADNPAQLASEYLRTLGIPGLRYLDQGSRHAKPQVLFGGQPITSSTFDDLSAVEKDALNAIDNVATYLTSLDPQVSVEQILHEAERYRTSGANQTLDAEGFPTSQSDREFRDAVRALGKRLSIQEAQGTHNFVIWDENEIKTLERLYQRPQPVEGTPLTAGVRPDRGQIEIGAPTAEGGRSFSVTLHPAADESTLLHEVGHALSVILSDLAARPGAPADMVKDAETYAQFAGYASAAERHAALDPAKEEKANNAWEQYHQEGKAPTPELASVFARFKDWLTRIYLKLKTGLTDEMRGVFARMLGGEPEPEQPAAAAPAQEAAPPKEPKEPKGEGDQPAEKSLPQMMVDRYGGTPEEWAKKLSNPELSSLLKQGPVEDPPLNRGDLDNRANELIEGTKIGEIRPAKYDTTAENLTHRILNFAASKVTGQAAGVRPPGEGKAIEQTVSLTDLERARDFNYLLAKKATAVQEEMSRALANIMQNARSIELRAQLGLASPAFRDVFDRINEAIGAKRHVDTNDRVGLPAMLQVMKDVGLASGFDEGAIQNLLEQPKSWPKMTPPEARTVADALYSIRTMAARLNQIAVGDKMRTLRDTQEDALVQNAGRKDLGAPALTRSAEEWIKRGPLALAGVLNAWNLKPETAFQALGPTLHKVFLKTIDARNYKWELQGSILKHFVEKVRDISWLKEPIETDLKLPQIGDLKLVPPEDTNEERQGSRPLPEALARSYGSTPEAWEELLNSPQTLEDMPTVRDLIEQGKKDLAASRSIQSVPDLSRKMNKETLAMIFLNLGNDGNEQRLTSGYNWKTEKLLEEIGKNLTPEQCDQLQSVLDLLTDQLWPLIRAHAEKTTGLAPKQVIARPFTITFANGEKHTFRGGYFPLAPHPDALNVPVKGEKERGVAQYDRAARMTVEASFIKDRASQATYPVDLNWSRVGKHIDGVLHYLAYDQPVRDIGQLFKDDRIESIIRHSVGDSELKSLRAWHALLARGKQDNIGFWDSAVRHTLRSRAISNYLAFSAPISIMQMSHIPFAVTSGEISAKNTSLALLRQFPFTDAWEETRNRFTELQFRSTRWAQLFRQAISGESSELTGQVKQWADKAGFLHMEAADAMLSHWIADAAYNDALEKNMPDEEAVEYANAKVRLLMPTHNIFEMAPIVRDRGALGALMLFRGLPNVVWNVNYNLMDSARQARNAARQQLRLGGGAPQPLVGGGLTGENEGPTVEMENEGGGTFGVRHPRWFTATNFIRLAAASAVLAVIGKFLDGLGKDRDDGAGIEGWANWAMRLAIGSQTESLGPVHDLTQPMVDAAIQGKSPGWAIERMSRSVPEVATVIGILRDVGRVAAHHSTDEQRVKGAISAALTLAGYGGQPLAATGERIYDSLAGNREVRGLGDALDIVAYPTRELTKTPLTTGQDIFSGEKTLPRHVPRR